MNKLLERMCTEEARTNGRTIYFTYDSLGLEREYNTAILAQHTFVGKCRANPEDRVHLENYLRRFPGIPGEVGLEDLSIGNLAATASAASASVSPVTAPGPDSLPRTIPLAEGMEVYVDGKVGAVVVSPDRDITPQNSKVLVQSRGMTPYEVEVSRCFIAPFRFSGQG